MNYERVESYINKVYGYAMNHTYSREEADELAQEILFTIIRELPKLRDESKLESWIWGIARNVTKSFRRSQGRQRAMYSYDTLENLSYEDSYSIEDEEIYDYLRTKIAMLSATYRDIIVLHYYEGLSTGLIAEKLNIPEGTVRWRLLEARKKLKKECETMETTALKPVTLKIRINGGGDYNGTTIPFPYTFIDDALSQNILHYCYEHPKTVEELAKLCGVPAYYIEDRLENLIKREAVSEAVKGKYRTEFIIYTDRTIEYELKTDPLFIDIVDPFVAAMKKLADSVDTIDIYMADKSKDDLLYLYGLMALEHLSKSYNPVKSSGYRVRYDGNRWSYHAFLLTGAKHNARGLSMEVSENRRKSGSYKHCSYHFGGFAYRKVMIDYQINICEDILAGREVQDIEAATSAIKEGYIVNKDGSLFVTVPAFTKAQYEQFKKCAEITFESVMKKYVDTLRKYLEGYKKLFPAHLEEEVLNACNYLFLKQYTVICNLAKEKGLLKTPTTGSTCDVMIQY